MHQLARPGMAQHGLNEESHMISGRREHARSVTVVLLIAHTHSCSSTPVCYQVLQEALEIP